MEHNNYNDEEIKAFIDKTMDAATRRDFIAKMQNDEQLKREVAFQTRLKLAVENEKMLALKMALQRIHADNPIQPEKGAAEEIENALEEKQPHNFVPKNHFPKIVAVAIIIAIILVLVLIYFGFIFNKTNSEINTPPIINDSIVEDTLFKKDTGALFPTDTTATNTQDSTQRKKKEKRKTTNNNTPKIEPLPKMLRIDAVYIGRQEVNVADFRKFVEATNYKTIADMEGFSYVYINGEWTAQKGVNWTCDAQGRPLKATDEQLPVVHIAWYDAIEYCIWLSKTEGLKPRLSIVKSKKDENNTNNGDKYKWIVRDERANNGYTLLFENFWDLVKKSEKAALMEGKVWDWCWNWDPYTSSNKSKEEPPSGKYRVLKFGKTGKREIADPYITRGDIGFRVFRWADD